MRKGPAIVMFAVIPAIFVAGVVVLVGTAAKPPRFTARTTIAVDWNAMPSVPNDEQAEKVRTEWRKQVVREVIQLPASDTELADILERANALSNNLSTNNTIIAKLRNGLRIVLLKQTDESDQFTIEVQNNNTNFAETAVRCVVQGISSKLKTEASTAGGLAALRSYSNVEEVVLRKDELAVERQRLQARASSYEARQRIQEIEGELSKLEWAHTEAGFGLAVSLSHALFPSDPVRSVSGIQIEARGNKFAFGVLFTAVICGCVAGMLGFGMHRFVFVKPMAPRTPSRIPPIAPPIPPFATHPNRTPPIIPPPFLVHPKP